MTREEALKIVRENYPHFGTTEPWLDLEKALATLIPELRESEDERIIEEIKFAVMQMPSERQDTKQRCLSWLEKQKVFAEHGYGLYYYHNGGFTFVARPAEEKDEENPYDFAMSQQEKQKEQTWIPTDEQRTALGMVLKHSDPDADSTKVLESLLDELTKIANPKVAKWKEKQKEQKPLSPDEKMNHSLYLEGFDVGREVGKVEAEQKPEDRFEEAREKYQVEWSEEDENIRQSLILLVSNDKINGYTEFYKAQEITCDKAIAFLKSLRPSWKPSEEQMNILKAVKEHVGRGSGYWGEGLGSLIEDLEKLM